MYEQELAIRLSNKTLLESDFDKAVRFTLNYLQGLSVTENFDEVDVLLQLSKLDKRFKNGSCKDVKSFSADSFYTAGGTLYVGRSLVQLIKENDYTAFLYIMGKGL